MSLFEIKEALILVLTLAGIVYGIVKAIKSDNV